MLVDRVSGVTDRIERSRSRLSTECKLLVDLPDFTTKVPPLARPFALSLVTSESVFIIDTGEEEGSPRPMPDPGEVIPALSSNELVWMVDGRGSGAAVTDGEAMTGEAKRDREAELAGRGIALLFSMPSGTSSSSSESAVADLSTVSLGRRMPRLKAATLTLAADISSMVRTDTAEEGLDMLGRAGGAGFHSSSAAPSASATVASATVSAFS